MKESPLKKKSYEFTIRIVNLSQYLQNERKGYVLSEQVLRSGTGIGALTRESEFGQGRAGFTSKMSIPLKEVNETDYWLSILKDTKYIGGELFESLFNDCHEIIAMLVSTVKTSKQ